VTTGGGRAHLVGLAGVGMSALAEALRASGREVSGSDRGFDRGDTLPVLDVLSKQGIRCYRQDGSGVAGDVSEVVVSTAIESDNPDLLAANTLGVSGRSPVTGVGAAGRRRNRGNGYLREKHSHRNDRLGARSGRAYAQGGEWSAGVGMDVAGADGSGMVGERNGGLRGG
jgi:hypothetical protein